MFVGHYGVSFGVQRVRRDIPLWVLFVAAQLLDVFWAPFILLGIERVRIVPGITATNALDLYYMPYTHSLVGALAWSAAGYAVYRVWRGSGAVVHRSALLVGVVVFSHWILDAVVHRPDLPLYDDAAKVGLGLWNRPALAFGMETALLFGGMALFWSERRAPKSGMIVFGIIMLAVQALVFFGPPPPSGAAAAATGLIAYLIFAGFVAWWEARHPWVRP